MRLDTIITLVVISLPYITLVIGYTMQDISSTIFVTFIILTMVSIVGSYIYVGMQNN